MNKSLKVLLEQPKKKPTAQPSEPVQQNTPTNNTQTPPPPAPTQPAVEEPAKDSLKYFNDFTFYDQDEKEIKFSDDEKKEVMSLLPKFKNIGNKKYDDDDAFVRAAIFFKQDNKNVMVYYVDFLTTPDIKLVADNHKRIGLGLSVLLEQSFKSRM